VKCASVVTCNFYSADFDATAIDPLDYVCLSLCSRQMEHGGSLALLRTRPCRSWKRLPYRLEQHRASQAVVRSLPTTRRVAVHRARTTFACLHRQTPPPRSLSEVRGPERKHTHRKGYYYNGCCFNSALPQYITKLAWTQKAGLFVDQIQAQLRAALPQQLSRGVANSE
jgi:hypothetical protein